MKTLIHKELNKDESECVDFRKLKDLTQYVCEIAPKTNKLVYVISIKMFGDVCDSNIFVSQEYYEFISLITSNPSFYDEFTEEVFVGEFASYEDAYDFALDLREGNDLCYNLDSDVVRYLSQNN